MFTCDPETHHCIGCTGDQDCPTYEICDLVTTECKDGCSTDYQCPPDEICDPTTNQCKLGCSELYPCDPASKKTCCGSTCADLLWDEYNCGKCGHVCGPNPPNAVGTCLVGTCKPTCNANGMVDCNEIFEDGCEVDKHVDIDNCGGCGNQCFSGLHMQTTCNIGSCEYTCDGGFTDCDLDKSNGCEVDVLSDASNCGGCGTVCGAVQACTAGVCL